LDVGCSAFTDPWISLLTDHSFTRQPVQSSSRSSTTLRLLSRA